MIIQSIKERTINIHRSLSFVWTSARNWTFTWLLLLFVQGLLPVATVYLTKLIVDDVAAAAGAGARWETISPILLAGALMAAVLLLTELLGNAITWIREIQAERLKNYISSLIHQKSIEADLAFYESSEFYDHLHRARDEAGYRPVALLENLGSVFQNGITLVAMAAVLIRFGLWIPVALFVSTLPAFYVVLRFSRKQHRLWTETTSDERRSWYYDWLLTSGESASELRLFSIGDHFSSLYQLLRQGLFQKRLKLTGKRTLAQLAAGMIGLAITAGALAWMVWRVVQGAGTLGDLALFYQAFNKGQGLMRSMLHNVGQVYSNSLFLGSLFEFLALRPKVVDPTNPVRFPSLVRKGISLENVSFRYPGSERPALRDFSLELPAGQMTALVGANGAGKSTLIKLICRFYDPCSGHIRLDGVDLRDFEVRELRQAITVLFQKPVQYNDTVSRNISLGNLRMNPSHRDIEHAAAAAGAEGTIVQLPDGYDTRLGRMFENGEELSVGQWQRIALARAFLRRAPILLLDEPTSAMDSWAEADWLGRIRDQIRGQTVLIITHRFSTAMHADRIHVMDSGRIVESGTHQELIGLKGMYERGYVSSSRRSNV
jgi:ATP-binding cassette subfamily B protein